MYNKSSVKSVERLGRGAGERLIVSGGQMKRPRQWKDFLANDESKVQFIELLLKAWSSPSSAPILQGRKVILTCEGKAYGLQVEKR